MNSVDMPQFEYRELAKDCLEVNKDKLGIVSSVIPAILRELNNQHKIEDWETKWLTYLDKRLYLNLSCVDDKQKEKLWCLVQELWEHFYGVPVAELKLDQYDQPHGEIPQEARISQHLSMAEMLLLLQQM